MLVKWVLVTATCSEVCIAAKCAEYQTVEVL
jgi:hypothetical protein